MRTAFALCIFVASISCNGAPPPGAPPAKAPAPPSASATIEPPRDPNAPVQIAAGDGFWCGRRADGVVRCHGANDRGQLGGARAKSGDADVVGIANATAIVASGDNACARLADGTAKCWGGRDHGKPVDVEAFAGAASLVSTPAGVCARLASGAVRCRADDGYADAAAISPVIADAVQTESMRVDASDGTSRTTSCALRPDGAVLCWGANDLGQIGDGTTKDRDKPTRVATISDAVEIRLEWGRACARLRDGSVKCWGDNERGLLVPGAPAVLKTPATVKGIAGAIRIALGAEHACAVVKDGSLRCWGEAADMPNGWEFAVKDAPQPVTIPDVARVAGIVVRAVDTCVWRDDGRVQCWQKAGKETGLDATWDDDNFVPWIDDAVEVALSVNEWCARTKGGRVKCWGDRWYGEAAPVPKLDRATEIADGQLHACARIDGGAVKCWGWNVEGSLGAPGRGLVDDAVDVVGLAGAVHVAVGAMHSVAVVSDGTVRAWRSSFGKGEPSLTTVEGVRGAVEIAAGAHHACARLGDGTIACWGEGGKGQLGADAPRDRTAPSLVPGISDAIAIAASQDLSCALRRVGKVVCWGTMSAKDGAKERAPTAIDGIADAVQVAVGTGVAYALRKDGAVFAIDANRTARSVSAP